MINKNYRKAFSLLVTIAIIVIMSSVAMLVTALSGKIIKTTTTQFRKEQAVLLARSYTEYAIMAVTANDRSQDCLEDIDAYNVIGNSDNGEGFRVRTRISYIGSDNQNLTNCASVRVFSDEVQTNESNLSIIVDVYVEHKELDNPDSQWITYHRRTLQKI